MEKLELIIFAAIAVILLWKLFNTIGRTDVGKHQGEIKPNNPQPKPTKAQPNVESLIKKPEEMPQPQPEEELQEEVPKKLQEAYGRVTKLDRSFTLASFISGAESAFEYILNAFTKGDEKGLKPLVSSEIMKGFTSVIKDRAKDNEQVENTLLGFEETEVLDIELKNTTANIVVKFVSEQINLVKDATGKIVDGSSSHINHITDTWTFERNLLSSDKSWKLVATS